ncbi:MAG: surface polysaccharide O-acyltransferase-like enzyme [Candidatus Nanohaloarchaea archaeon]|jgi:surface polysaccharide O-acyltransferase-like enzyme
MNDRIESLDTLKGLALLSVVLIHIRGYFIGETLQPDSLSFIVLNTARFAIPVFFLTSGYLFKKKLEEKEEKSYTRKYLRKLVYYYLLASALYLALQLVLIAVETFTGLTLPISRVNITGGLELLYNFIYTGNAVRGSLWFFTALIFSIGVIYTFEKYKKFDILLFTAGLLHLIGILANTYSVVSLPLPARDGFFFGLFYTSIGFKLSGKGLEVLKRHRQKLLITLPIFGVLNLLERAFITEVAGINPFFWQDYSFFTLPFALSIFLIGILYPNLGSQTRINLYGKYTLWGYILHQIIGSVLIGITILVGLIAGNNLLQNSALNLLTAVLAYTITMEAVIRYNNR